MFALIAIDPPIRVQDSNAKKLRLATEDSMYFTYPSPTKTKTNETKPLTWHYIIITVHLMTLYDITDRIMSPSPSISMAALALVSASPARLLSVVPKDVDILTQSSLALTLQVLILAWAVWCQKRDNEFQEKTETRGRGGQGQGG